MKYYVFRRYVRIDSDENLKESFALHFVKPFRSRALAQVSIKNAKLMQPWQEFIILRG